MLKKTNNTQKTKKMNCRDIFNNNKQQKNKVKKI